MKHLNEEELIDHYYGIDRNEHSAGADGDGYVAQHIRECAECGTEYAALESDLSDLAEFDPPHQETKYGQRVWESIANSLPEKPYRKFLWGPPELWQGLGYASVAAILLAGTFYAGRMWEHSKTPVTASEPHISKPVAPRRVVVVVLSDHLDRTERLLMELKHTDADESDMLSPLREGARNLLPANRICQREAEKSDDRELNKALADLDRLLTGLADQRGGLDSAELMRLQKQMNADGLLFEVRMLRSRIPATEKASGTPSKGDNI